MGACERTHQMLSAFSVYLILEGLLIVLIDVERQIKLILSDEYSAATISTSTFCNQYAKVRDDAHMDSHRC